MKTNIKLEDFGYSGYIKEPELQLNLMDFEPGRIVSEHKERYIICTERGELEAEITGNMRFSSASREDFPVVGDWVAVNVYDSGPAIIHKIFPRYSLLKRSAAGSRGEAQPIAANVDFAFLIQGIDRDFNLNRLERYLAICYSSKVSPIIVLTKSDLAEKDFTLKLLETIRERITNVPVLSISNETGEGLESLKKLLIRGKTYCMLGSSGAGKSTLINNLSGENRMQTGAVSSATNKGRHVTSHREMIVLEEGGIIIDNPGMREVGLADAEGGLELTFELIAQLSKDCRFKDCTHTNEKGCSVIEAVEKGTLDKIAYENYLKLERETSFYETSAMERKRKDKRFGKILKDYHRQMNKQNK